MKISFEGEPEEIERFLKRLAKEGLTDETGDTKQKGKQEGATPAVETPLSPEEIPQLLNQLTDGARKLALELAKRPNGYPFEDLQKATNLSGTQIAGQMSSIGHKMHRFFKGKAEPITRDYSQRVYRMSPEVSEAIRQFAQS